MKKISILLMLMLAISLHAGKLKQKTEAISLEPATQSTAIDGQAFLKTNGGDVKTCAGEIIYIYKQNDYSKLKEKAQHENRIKFLGGLKTTEDIYKNSGFMSKAFWLKSLNFNISLLIKFYPTFNINQEYEATSYNADINRVIDFEKEQLTKIGVISNPIFESQCDANGNFSFKNIPFGNYGILTTVFWRVGDKPNGGKVGKEVVVDNNLQRIFITESFPSP